MEIWERIVNCHQSENLLICVHVKRERKKRTEEGTRILLASSLSLTDANLVAEFGVWKEEGIYLSLGP